MLTLWGINSTVHNVLYERVCTDPPAYKHGLADLLVRTQGALYAYRQRQHPGALPFAFLLGALMLAMAAAAVMHAQTGGSRVRGTDAVETRRSSEQRWRDD